MGYWGYSFPPRLTVAQRRAKATREIAKLTKKGQTVTPVVIEGRKIANTFWGKAWCDNLESYSDFETRLPRGRSYVLNGSVCDLQIEPGRVTALVCGTELYRISITIKPLAPVEWRTIKAQCAGQIGSLIELLQGKLSKGVMDVVTRLDGGLFPKPREIEMDCSCPDWADMCKHVAAALYGVGARLDHQPELLFKLRKVDHLELIGEAGAATAAAGRRRKTSARTLAPADLADVFGVELEPVNIPDAPAQPRAPKTWRAEHPTRKSESHGGTPPPAKTRRRSKPPTGANRRRAAAS
jgi:uncharacterized Zn finger protein